MVLCPRCGKPITQCTCRNDENGDSSGDPSNKPFSPENRPKVDRNRLPLTQLTRPDFAEITDMSKTDFAKEYNQRLKEYCEENGLAKYADFSDFDPTVSYDFAKAAEDAKNDFPELSINYMGSIDHQVQLMHDRFEKMSLNYYLNEKGFSMEDAQKAAADLADFYITDNGYDDTEDTYAWSLHPGHRSMSIFDGVAVNTDYAKNYDHFLEKKQYNELTKWSPLGSGTPRGVMDHEMGHEIDNLLNASADPVIQDLYNDMMYNGNAEEELSGYSADSVEEFIAEAYSEYRNNPNRRPTCVAVYNRLIELRDEKTLVKVKTLRG